MKINTKLDVGSRLYTIINQNSTSVIGFLIVKSIKVEVSEYDNKITYDLDKRKLGGILCQIKGLIKTY